MQEVLFVCTGNFYRSRFAEALFNHEAELRGLGWRAFSRGLAIHWAEGDLSQITADALRRKGIDKRHTGRTRVSLTLEDLQRADRVVILDEREHRPMLLEQFPDWVEKVDFWTCQDIQWEKPTSCMPRIEEKVAALIEELAGAEEPGMRSRA